MTGRFRALGLCVVLVALSDAPSPAVALSSSGVDSASARAQASSDWSSVVHLAAGRQILLTGGTLRQSECYVIDVDDSAITLLNLAGVDMPNDVRAVLRETVTRHPDDFLQARRGQVFTLEKGVRLTDEGLDRNGQKLADLDAIILRVPRGDVAEISVRAKHIGAHIRRGALIGVAAGAAMGVAYGAASTSRNDNAFNVGLVGAAIGAAAGMQLGAIIGAAAPRTPEVIYRARPSPSTSV